MALDPNKKKPVQGTQIGNFTLLPGSGADDVAKAVGSYRAGLDQTNAQVNQYLKTRPQFITPDGGQIPDKAFRSPQGGGGAAPLPLPKSGVTPVLIDPANAASMQLTPPSRADAYAARTPAVPASTAGASAPVGGGAAPLPPVVNLGASAAYGGGGTVRNSLASSVTNGVPTYDNASIDRLNARNANPATSGAQSFGGTATPLALPTAAVAPQPNLNVNLPRPVVADAYNTREANADMKKVADSIDTALFRNSFAADRGSRSARDAQAQMLGTLAALQGKRLDVASNVAGGDRDTAARYDLTGVDQQGQNQRALLTDTGETTRTGLSEAGANQRTQLQTLAELNKPTQVTDANGNVVNVAGGKFAPITDAAGNPLKAPSVKDQTVASPDAILTAYNAARKSIDDAAALTGKPADYSQIDPTLAARAQQVLAGNTTANAAPSAPAVGTVKNGYRFKGGNPADRNSWEKTS